MATITLGQLTGTLAFLVQNNQKGVSKALSSMGYTPAKDAAGLVNQLVSIFAKEGTDKLSQIVAKVPIDTTVNTTTDIQAIYENLTGSKLDTTSASKFTWTDIASLISGSTVTAGGNSTTTTTTKPAISPTAIIITAIIAIAAVVFIYKFA